MKTRTSQFLIIALLSVMTLFLSACQVNFITEIKNNGSGLYTQEIGFQDDEASMAGLSDGSEDFCAGQNTELPPNTSIRQEIRNEDETWCVYETPFNSLDDLKTIYSLTDTRLNSIAIADGQLTYDISLDLSSDSTLPTGADIFWIVTMPGNVIEHNATEQNGNTLKWKLVGGEINHVYAVSKAGGFTFGGSTTWIIFSILCLCMCFIVVLVVAGVIIFIQRRNKNISKTEKPVEAPLASPSEQ